ncbi:polysaccharide deacetylase family protein [Xanthobacteraceae bacterium A53D]
MKAVLAVSAVAVAAALGLGIACSQILTSAPAPTTALTPVASAPPPAAPQVQPSSEPARLDAKLAQALTTAQPSRPALPGQATLPPLPGAYTPPAAAPVAAQPNAAQPGTALPDFWSPPKADAPPAQALAAGTPPTPASMSGMRFAEVDGPYIAITFDDGPNPETTTRLLRMLEQRGIKATFFVLGSNAAAHPDVIRAIAAAGHEIGNHSWNHPQLPKLSEAALDKQIEDTNTAIQNVTGKRPVYLRPPYGAMTSPVQKHIEQKYGMSLIYWSVDPLDWKVRDPQKVSEAIMTHVRPGSIVLAHDIHATTVAAMPALLDQLLAKGYKFLTVSELIARHRPAPPKVATATGAAAAAGAATAAATQRKKPRPAQPKPVAQQPAPQQPRPVQQPTYAPRPAAAVPSAPLAAPMQIQPATVARGNSLGGAF